MSTTYKTEAKFLRIATAFLETVGAVVIREAYATRTGTPDLICCYMGRFIAFELKDDIGRPSTAQLSFIERIKKAGGRAVVANCLLQLSIPLSEILQECGE